MPQFIDLAGKKFNRLTVLQRVENRKKTVMWLCKCDCGNETIVDGFSINHGKTKSCGCLQSEKAKENAKHGKTGTRIYRIHHNMKERCFNKNNHRYKSYGGRGITICDEWLGKNGFICFYNWAIKNGYKDDLTIERIDNNGNYCPENCTWIPLQDQVKNKTSNIYVELNGEKLNLFSFCRKYNHNYDLVRNRISRWGWDLERALTQSADRHKYYEYNGEKYSLQQLSDFLGLSIPAIKARLKTIWTIEKLFEYVEKNGKFNINTKKS